MAHFCVFCDKSYQTFTSLRHHKCPSNYYEETTFDYPESDKENEIFLVKEKVKMSTAVSHAHFQQEMKMSETETSYSYMMGFYHDAGNRNEKEMNVTEIKDDSNMGSSDDSMDRCALSDSTVDETEKDSRETYHLEDSNSADSSYVYTLDTSDTIDSDAEKLNDKMKKENGIEIVETTNDSNEQSTGYVYVLESDNSVKEESQEPKKGNVENNAENLSKHLVDTHGNHKLPGKKVTRDSEESSTSAVFSHHKAITKDESLKSNETHRLVGASRRKRKFCLENAITQIKKSKPSMDSSFNVLETKTEAPKSSTDCVLNKPNGIDLSIHATQSNIKEEKQTEEKSSLQTVSDNLPEDLTVPKKTNRRKSSFVSRCVNVDEAHEVKATKTFVNEKADSFPNQPLDFSVHKSADIKPAEIKRADAIPVETKTDMSKKATSLANEKAEAIDLTVGSITKTDGIKRAKTDAPFIPHQAQFMNWMKKFSPNFMNQNMMMNMMQFQLWMQAAAMNKAGGNKNAKHVAKNDLNKNVIIGDMLAGQAIPGITNAGIKDERFLNGVKPYTPRRKPKSDLVEQNFVKNTNTPNYEIKDDSDEISTEGITNWTSDANNAEPNRKLLTSFKEKDGELVRFFVRDNDQVKAILGCLIPAGAVGADEVIVGTEEMRYICRVCDQRFFHVEHLTKHVKQRHILKKYQCSMCERSFHDAGNYRQHMRVHDANDVPYECPECQRKFRHKCTLKVHMRIHTGEKPFKCDVCQASFKISSGLQTHMRKHTGETPYACEFCNLRFKCQSNLKQHLFQHTQARPFACEICGKTYSRKSIRDSHMQTHFR